MENALFTSGLDIYETPEWIQKGSNLIHQTAIVMSNVELGEDNIFYPYSVIGMGGFMRNRKPTGKVVIGSGNTFGNFSCVMVGQDGITKIGDNNMIMNYVNVGHDSVIGSDNEIVAKTIICGHTEIGNRNKIKAGCTIRNRLTIGDDNVIGQGSNVVEDIGFSQKWYGNPARLR